MFAILAGLAVIAAAPEGPTEQVCAYALDSVKVDSTTEDLWERYIGRMEVRMMDLRYSDGQKEAVRMLCDAYLRGAARGMTLIVQQQNAKTASK